MARENLVEEKNEIEQAEDLVRGLLYRPASYQALGEIISINPKELTPAGRIDYLAALEKQHSWLTSLIHEATLAIAGVAAIESNSVFDGIDEAEREDVSTALRLSPPTAQNRIDLARVITAHLPATARALSTGSISALHAQSIAREIHEGLRRGFPTDQLSEIDQRAVSHCEFHTPNQVARKVRHLIVSKSPEVFEEIVESARQNRDLILQPEIDGMSTLIALLPAEDAQIIYLAVNALLENDKSDESIGARRADALTRLATHYLQEHNEKHLSHGRPVTINITMDLPTALGLAENPGILSGYGSIPANVARALAADGRWRKFITDPVDGRLLDCGRESYLPSQHLVDFLTARDRICRFPGCSQPARVSDIDHAQSWQEGGETSAENLGFLCRRHHRLKTHGGWRLESFIDGSCRWISPLGKMIHVPVRPMSDVV
jgi:hypothetical protein